MACPRTEFARTEKHSSALHCHYSRLLSESLIEGLERHESITGGALWIDNIAAALLLGLVVFLYERRRERELIKRLRVIELMNHHVRNALQPVMYIPYSQDQQQQLNTIRDAVNRIDWALREILPGAPQEDSSPPRQSAA